MEIKNEAVCLAAPIKTFYNFIDITHRIVSAFWCLDKLDAVEKPYSTRFKLLGPCCHIYEATLWFFQAYCTCTKSPFFELERLYTPTQKDSLFTYGLIEPSKRFRVLFLLRRGGKQRALASGRLGLSYYG